MSHNQSSDECGYGEAAHDHPHPDRQRAPSCGCSYMRHLWPSHGLRYRVRLVILVRTLCEAQELSNDPEVVSL